jgi:hypothetical protein
MCIKKHIGEKILTELDAPILTDFKFIESGKQLFIHSLSLLIEYYLSSAVGPSSGVKDNSIKPLFVRCINDLVVGFHLANHAYVNQFYSVTRPIFEALDLIELFKKDESLADIWSNDPEKFKNQYTPVNIRVKIGRDRFDPVYRLFCQFGSHPTFDGMKSNVYLLKKETNEKTTLMITLGPTDLFIPAIRPFAFSYILLSKVSISIVDFFSNKSTLDARKLLKSIVENYKEFKEKCIYEGFSFHKIDITPIQEVIEQTNSMIETLDRKISKTSIP